MREGAMEYAMSLLKLGVLEIDDDGRIWRTAIRPRDAWKPITPRRAENVGGKGYLRVSLAEPCGTGNLYILMAHRLVYIWKIGPIPDGLQINHRDLNKQNNHPSNLEIATGVGNIQHSYANGRNRPWGVATEWRGQPRQNRSTPYVTNELKDAIRAKRAAGVTLREISDEFGFPVSKIAYVCNGQRLPKQISEELKTSIRALRAGGGTIRGIAQELGLLELYISLICKEVTENDNLAGMEVE